MGGKYSSIHFYSLPELTLGEGQGTPWNADTPPSCHHAAVPKANVKMTTNAKQYYTTENDTHYNTRTTSMNSPNLAFMLRRQISQCLTNLGIKWSAGNIYRTFTMSPVALHRTKNLVWLLKTKWTPHTLLRSTNQVIYIRAPATVIFFFFLKTWLFYEHKILKIGTVEYWDRFPDIRNLSVPYRFKREKVLHPQLLVFVWKIYMYVKTGLEKMIVHEIAILNKK